jgi:hypothetical protein
MVFPRGPHPSVDVRSAEVVEELIEPGGARDVLINNATATSLPVPGRTRIARSTVGLSIVASYAWTLSPHVAPSGMAKTGVLAMT